MDKKIETAFKKFMDIHNEKAFLKLSSFLNEYRETFEKEKMNPSKTAKQN